jgi:hypothetical protein
MVDSLSPAAPRLDSNAAAPDDVASVVQDLLAATGGSGQGASPSSPIAPASATSGTSGVQSAGQADLNAFLSVIDAGADNIRGWGWSATRDFGAFSVKLVIARARQGDYLTQDANGNYQANWDEIGAALRSETPVIVVEIALKNPPPGTPGTYQLAWDTSTGTLKAGLLQSVGPSWPPKPEIGPDTRPFRIWGETFIGTSGTQNYWGGGLGATVGIEVQVPYAGAAIEKVGQMLASIVARAGTTAGSGTGPFGIALSTLAALGIAEMSRGWSVWVGPRLGGSLTLELDDPLASILNIGGNRFVLGDAFGQQLTDFFANDTSPLAGWFRSVLNLPPMTVEVDDLVLGPVRDGSPDSDRVANSVIKMGAAAMIDQGVDALSLLMQSYRLYQGAGTNENLQKNAGAIWNTNDSRMEVARAIFVTLYAVEDKNGNPLDFASMTPAERQAVFEGGSGIRFRVNDPGLTVANVASRLDSLSSQPPGSMAPPDEGMARIRALRDRLAFLGYGDLNFGSRYLSQAPSTVSSGMVPPYDVMQVMTYFGRNDLRPATSTRAPFPGADQSLSSQDNLKSGLLSAAFLFGSESGIEVNTQALSAGFKSEIVKDVQKAIVQANVADPVGGTAKVAKALEETRSSYISGSVEDGAMEAAITEAVRSDTQLKDAFAPLQLDIVKADGATLTPYQEGVFLQRFKELVPAQTIDEARANALLAAQAATGQTFDNFDLGKAQFVMSPGRSFNFEDAAEDIAKQSSNPLSGDKIFTSALGSYAARESAALFDSKAGTLELSQFRLQDGNLQYAEFRTWLDDKTDVTVFVNFNQDKVTIDYYKSPDNPTYDAEKSWWKSETLTLSPEMKASIGGLVRNTFDTQPKIAPLDNALGANNMLITSTGNREDAIAAAMAHPWINYNPPGPTGYSDYENRMTYSVVVEDKDGRFWVETYTATIPPGMNRQELAAWVQTQKDNVTALYKPDTVKNIDLFYDKDYVPTDGVSNLPEPQTPPGVEPGNGESFAGASYPAANAQDAGRIAGGLIYGQAPGSFVVVMYNPDTRGYWVDGPYPGPEKPSDVAGRYPAPFVRAATINAQ